MREMRRPELPTSPTVGVPVGPGLIAVPAAAVYQPPSWDGHAAIAASLGAPPEVAAPRVRIVHKDVGKKKDGPSAFCTGQESGVVCTDEWLDVTCAACHARRHPQAPLSLDERARQLRAIAPGLHRPLTREEIDYDNKHRDPWWDKN